MLGDKPTSINSDILFCGVFEESNVSADVDDKDVCDVFSVVSNRLMSTFFFFVTNENTITQSFKVKKKRLTLA